LRNMVSSLFEHEQIQTTVAKAKEASRIAEWVITWGKQGTETQRRRAQGFLMVSLVYHCFSRPAKDSRSRRTA
jgi:large subunit ribosomal protein L17